MYINILYVCTWHSATSIEACLVFSGIFEMVFANFHLPGKDKSLFSTIKASQALSSAE